MSESLVIIRRVLIALLAAFVICRVSLYLFAKGFAQFELIDFMVMIPILLMALFLFAVCIKALWRHATS